MLRAAAEGGLRRSEICGLRFHDIDLRAGRLEVRRGYNGGPTKGRQARTVHIGPTFVQRLSAYRAMLPATPHPSMPVWPGRGGKELAEHSATQAAARAFARAGLEDVVLHDLRRTCGSLMLSRGIPLIVVSRHLGHATPLVTARVYAHLLRDDQLAAVPAAFEEALRAQGSQQARNNRDA